MNHSDVANNLIGRTDLTTNRISLGSVTFGREIDEEASYRVLDYAFEHGIRLIDMAEGYGGGNAQLRRKNKYGLDDRREVTTEMYSGEKIVSRWMKQRGCRDEIVLCTKVSSGSSSENIHNQVQASLERLGVDHVDIYMLHDVDTTVPLDETLDALDKQVGAGHVNVIGCSNFSAKLLREALNISKTNGYARFEVAQPPYSLANRTIETDSLPLCKHEQIATMTYSPLGAGFLSGKYKPTEERHGFPKGTRFDIAPTHADIYFNDRNFGILNQLRQKANELGEPMVYLAMAWVLGNPDLTTVLVGARNTEHIDNAVRARDEGISKALRNEMSAWGVD